MNHCAVHRLQEAVEAAKRAAHQAKMDNCDVGDIDEAIEAVEQELGKPTPNRNTLTLYLNSVARSLIGVPAARKACGEIDEALRAAGLPARRGPSPRPASGRTAQAPPASERRPSRGGAPRDGDGH